MNEHEIKNEITKLIGCISYPSNNQLEGVATLVCHKLKFEISDENLKYVQDVFKNTTLPSSDDCEHFYHNECSCVDGFCHKGEDII